MPLRIAKVRDDLEYFEQEVDDDTMVVVRDPVRGNYYKFNVLQAGMLRSLDGVRTPVQIAQHLSEEFEMEVPAAAAERFVARARELMLLDVACYQKTGDKARKQLDRALRRAGFRLRGMAGDEAVDRVDSAESALFLSAIRHLERGEPAKAADYLTAVLEVNPDNQRARQLHGIAEKAFLRSAGRTTDFPTFVLFDPTRILGWISRTVGPFLFSPWGVLAMVVYFCVAVHAMSTLSFSDLDIGFREIAIAFVVSRVSILIHEMSHGLACVYYGGRVTEIGVLLMYYVGLTAYCDTSSSYLFQRTRPKVIVQLAGTISSLLFLSTMAIVLSVMNPELPLYDGLLLELIIELIFASLTLIPFVKNDGYFAICDHFQLPNLRERSFRVTGAWLKRVCLGIDEPTEELSRRARRIFVFYAICCFLFTTAFVYYGVFRLFAPLIEWQGGWALVAAVVFSAFLVRRLALGPVLAMARLVVRERRRIFTRRRTALLVGVTALLLVPLTFRWPVLVDSEFVLAPVQRAYVRAHTPGVVERIMVREGESVPAGHELARLRNDALTARRVAVEGELAAVEAQLARLENGAGAEEISLARSSLARAYAEVGGSASEAALKRRMADEDVGLASEADAAVRTTRVAASRASAAASQLRLVAAGALPEQVTAVQADRNRLLANLQELRAQEERLVLRSPIAGVVVTPRVEELVSILLASGQTLLEVQDTRAFVAELAVPPWAPLGELQRDARVRLRRLGAPHESIEARLARVRDTVESEGDGRDNIYGANQVVAVTGALTIPGARAGMHGRARIYGESRSLAYAHLYLPLRRVVSIQLWSLW